MNWLAPLRSASRLASLESLEKRELLTVGLGTEIADFASQEELKSTLIEKAVAQHEWMFGQEVDNRFCIDWCGGGIPLPGPIFFDVADSIAAPSDGRGGLAGGGGAALEESFSDTNVQVAGVDEGDIVETDGDYVYILSNNLVTIVDVREQDRPRIASRVQLNENSFGREMYLDRDRLMVISNSSYYFDGGPVEPFGGGGPAIDFVSDIAFFPPSRQAVVATVIDISDREDAAILSETEVDGTLSNSRAIDGMGYLIVNDNLNFPTPEVNTVKFISEDGTMERTIDFYETEADYRARIGTSILDVLPNYTTYDSDGLPVAGGVVSTHADTFTTNDPNYGSIVSVVMIDMQGGDVPSVDAATTVMMNSGHQIFMSANSLYLFQSRWDGEEATSVMKFDIDTTADRVVPTASGAVPGRMLNQFSADEVRGELRIATTSGWGNRSSSGVYVLEETEDDSLDIKGSVTGLAKGEQIFSARFVGYRAYVVTFRQVDPLFSINLIDPENPVVEGELKIPGFSEYLQPIDEDHLLAIGRDADPNTGASLGLQLSLFDVSQITDPQLVDRFTFEGGRSTYSPAEHDHHAFSYFPEYTTLAVPVHSGGGGTWIREENGRREWVPAQWDQSLHVFHVDVEEGFEFTGSVEHPSEVRRSLRVNDALYSVSHDTLKVNDIRDPSRLLGQVHYLPPANGSVVPKDPQPAHIDGLFAAIATTENSPRFDMDGNQVVNDDDVDFLLEAAVGTNRGDANLDGIVNFADFLVVATNLGDDGGWADGDFNGDGVITLADFTILSDNFVAG